MSTRFDGVGTFVWQGPDGPVQLRKPRVVKPAASARIHRVTAGDRLDLLAARYLGDPDAGWRIVDANPTASPEELLEPGRLLRIPELDR